MKSINCLKKLALLCLLVPALAFSQNSTPPNKKVIIRIVQGDESMALSSFQTTLKLAKKSFKFQILFDHVDGVYVFASISDSIYRFTESSPIYDFSYLKLLQLREGDMFNQNKELNISETGWSFWFYSDSLDHSFNEKTVDLIDRGTVATKVIKQLYNVSEGKVIKLRNIQTPLYLFFIAVNEYDQDGRPKTELIRRKLKIEWTDEQ